MEKKPKVANTQHITSSLTRRAQHPVTDALPNDKQKLHDSLRARLDEISQASVSARSKEAKKRQAEEKVNLISAMAALYAPWSEKQWGIWAERVAEPFPSMQDVVFGFQTAYGQFIEKLLGIWLQHPPLEEERTASKRSQETKKAQKLVRAWYGNICAITGSNTTDVCHIIPNSVERNEETKFWGCLGMFWSPGQMKEMAEYIKKPEYQHKNLIVLDTAVHRHWGLARFALKPLPVEDDTQLSLEFHWLKPSKPGSVDHTRGDDATKIVNLRDDDPSGEELRTGDIIRLQSDDSKAYPLPDAGLLSLQYHLNRVVRAAGAAEVLELLFHGRKRPGAGAALTNNGGNMHELPPKPLCAPDPIFREFLILSALEQGILEPDEAEGWRKLLILDEDEYLQDEVKDEKVKDEMVKDEKEREKKEKKEDNNNVKNEDMLL